MLTFHNIPMLRLPGAMAERTKLEAYIVFSFLNTVIYCFPAHWCWAEDGWLRRLGYVDIAGAGPVHLVGGLTGEGGRIYVFPLDLRSND